MRARLHASTHWSGSQVGLTRSFTNSDGRSSRLSTCSRSPPPGSLDISKLISLPSADLSVRRRPNIRRQHRINHPTSIQGGPPTTANLGNYPWFPGRPGEAIEYLERAVRRTISCDGWCRQRVADFGSWLSSTVKRPALFRPLWHLKADSHDALMIDGSRSLFAMGRAFRARPLPNQHRK